MNSLGDAVALLTPALSIMIDGTAGARGPQARLRSRAGAPGAWLTIGGL
jgi:hypothetical protein